MSKIEPIELAGIPEGGTSKTGDRVWFSLETLDDRKFTFDCPQESVGEIVQCLEAWAEIAWKLRGSPNEAMVPEGTPLKAKARSFTDCRFAASKDHIILTLFAGPLQYSLAMRPEQCTRLSEALARARREWEARSRPN